jgi:hypothetical protein
VVLSFLLGREMGRNETPATTLVVQQPAYDPEPAYEQAPAEEAAPEYEEAPFATDDEFASEWESLAEEDFGRDPGADSGFAEAGAPDADAVARYFAELDAIEAGAKYWDDPQSLGMALLSQMQAGDTSGFDRLVDSQREARDRVSRLDVPTPCVEHHRRVTELLTVGVRMLEQVRNAAAAGDAASLLSLPGEAQKLAGQAREVDALGQRIRAEHGLPR